MSSLPLRRLGRLGDGRRWQSTYSRPDSTRVPRKDPTSSTPHPLRASRTAAHTHFLALPMYDGTFIERVTELREFMRERGSIAGIDPEIVIPNVRKTLLYRFGHINIKGFQPSKEALPDQPEYELDQVDEALNKANNRINAEVDKTALTLDWGSFSPVIPFFKDGAFKKTFNPAFVKILHLRSQLGAGWENAKKIQKELESASVANVKLRESLNVHIAIVNSRWRSVNESEFPKPFNIKTLYTIPGFDKFRTTPLPSSDDMLSRFTPADLGHSTMKNFVLEKVEPKAGQLESDPEFTKTYEFA
ncbi:hypothetical protein Clacol_007016 [Clathrus columnatus]|uniref:39S ribosomal protein L50, mitochondrial n=1 Tax=Clathrus columnatus TaxID=1419009 RepID=A0AAV5AJZ2_9AGAM|nr:hypothetical protein Clacol_007016 [Clathrus columnatus]